MARMIEEKRNVWNRIRASGHAKLTAEETELWRHIDALETEIAALTEKMACGHPKVCDKPGPDIVEAMNPKNVKHTTYCTACERTRLERTAVLRKAMEAVRKLKAGLGAGGHGAGMYTEIQVGGPICDAAQDAIDALIPASDASLADALLKETREEALEEAAQIAERAAIPGHIVQAPSCFSIAEKIRTLKGKS